MHTGFASLFDMRVTYLLRLGLRFQTPLLHSLSMTFDSCGLLLLAPRPGQRQRAEVLETAAEQDEIVEGLTEAELADLDA
jgi:hypothetical protein